MRRRVVVVGAGMVGHRFVEEAVRLDRDERLEIVLVGEEEYEPYNRILLTEVLAGRCDARALAMPLPAARVDFRRGCRVEAIDRQAGDVVLGGGERLAYDDVVLATGARPFVPPVTGLGPATPRHVHVLRSVDDCRHIAARAVNARHAVVVGGGVLGVEAACGLRRRGVPVTVLDVDATVMATQLDPEPGRVLAAHLGDLGVEVRVGTALDEVIAAYDELVAVRLTDGTVLAADLLVVSCGIRAETRLAAEAGLPVDRGIVVDDDLATADPRIHAIGDCAQPPGGGSGLLAPGWRQAERLAATLLGATAAVEAVEEDGIALKAAGVELLTRGIRPSQAQPDDRVITVSDPAGRRHLDLVVREGRLAGLTCLGAGDVAAALAAAFERGTPLPEDPLALLLPERRTDGASPMRMPGGTTVCRCNTVTRNDIVAAWEDGAATVEEVASRTRATTGCGGCTGVVRGLVDWLNSTDSTSPDQPAGVEPAVARA